MSGNRLPDYLDHLQEAAGQACLYVEGMTKSHFLADKRTQQAVIMNIVVIGEVATRLIRDYGSFLDQHPEVPCGA